jgi:uncharacterized membrane protein YgcG
MSFWCRLFGHKIERIEHGAGVAEFCSRMNCDHYKYERRRPLRFGSPDDREATRARAYEPIESGGAAPLSYATPLSDSYAQPWSGGGGESGGGGASASWDSGSSCDSGSSSSDSSCSASSD